MYSCLFDIPVDLQSEIKRMILIIDDSPTDIELTIMALEATGQEISVHTATDGKSALAMLSSGHELPAFILLDMKMPGMSGVEVIRKIRAGDRLRDIPVVVVTSTSLESDRAEAIASGASDYMQKPLALAQFSKALEAILHRLLPN